MRLLLDTHTFLWFIGGSAELSPTARGLIEEPGNERLLSVGSLWEMAIKVSTGRLRLGLSFPELDVREVEGNAIRLLEIKPVHLEELARLPFQHKDPFDRLLIAQGMAEGIPVVGKDAVFDLYPVKVLW